MYTKAVHDIVVLTLIHNTTSDFRKSRWPEFSLETITAMMMIITRPNSKLIFDDNFFPFKLLNLNKNK